VTIIVKIPQQYDCGLPWKQSNHYRLYRQHHKHVDTYL